MQFYHSKLLNFVSNVTYAFTSQDSGNLAFHVNDDPTNVRINNDKLVEELDYNRRTLVHMSK